MSTRQHLLERRDVPDADIERIIEVASELQDEDRRQAGRPTQAEVVRVAEELDIEARYVESAIGVIRDAKVEEGERAETRLQMRNRALGVLATALLLVGMTLAAMGASGRAALVSVNGEQARAEMALQLVLERQASLAPQLVALAGADTDLSTEVDAVLGAEEMGERLEAVDALNRRMSRVLAGLPATVPESTRLDLHHEITGGINRISIERRRLADVQAQADTAAQRMDVRLARRLGF